MAPPGAKNEDSTGDMEFPQFPGEDFLAHAATLYLEQAEARLNALQQQLAGSGR